MDEYNFSFMWFAILFASCYFGYHHEQKKVAKQIPVPVTDDKNTDASDYFIYIED